MHQIHVYNMIQAECKINRLMTRRIYNTEIRIIAKRYFNVWRLMNIFIFIYLTGEALFKNNVYYNKYNGKLK